MKPIPSGRLVLAALLAGATASLHGAITSGGTVYAKKFETSLLSEPKALAAPSTTVSSGRKLHVDEVRGVWLRVSDAGASGWVFVGNVSETKPVEVKGLDGLPLAASQTTATAAARPLSEVGAAYAARKNLGDARGDLEWLLKQSQSVTPGELKEFLQEQKKGEFQ